MQAKIARYKKAILTILGGGAVFAASFGLEVPGGEEGAAAFATVVATLFVLFGPKNAE